ncbi:ATP-binding protein [Alkalibacter mobilis]|uniref:ATP-binding protein n=1 Tax=Alkalibacter mobilis TaxID=2787712 RepID=UPI00189FCFC6|nr:MoxR family ATPase [Alkalibacter mobilis]MBF7096255.1 AAA family ATPase [Alkalibacter mobilis]
MNITEAKDQIKNTIKIYLKKDDFGEYKISSVRQRPIFLLGAPGIGKTAIMEQIAQEMGLALVSYSMTHHTRQSALGLPFIEHKNYGGKDHVVSEYTMSEIIASVYEVMEDSGKKEGILFLDEINCVSETLAPAMLQFLQYKVFGRHKVPEGWVVVTAGNPPEYNKSVREFDIVTMDRLKILEVKEDYSVWKKYASTKGIHGSILTYLDIKTDDFYSIETSIDGKSYITARGWEDLSEAITMYEEEKLDVNEELVGQYIRNKRAAKDFSIYYDLYNKYRKDYKVDEILNGNFISGVKEKAKEAGFDERLSLIGLLMESVLNEMRKHEMREAFLKEYVLVLKQIKIDCDIAGKEVSSIMENHVNSQHKMMQSEVAASNLSHEKKFIYHQVIKALNEDKDTLKNNNRISHKEAFDSLRHEFEKRVEEVKKNAISVGEKLHNMFGFVEEVYGEGREILVLVAELTSNYYGAKFISSKGSKDYYRHNKKLIFDEKQKEIMAEIEDLDVL